MTPEERVASLHTRMNAERRVRERRKTGMIGAACTALTVCLVLVIFGGGGDVHLGGVASLFSGATMLFNDAGGYILAAVIAFTAGVILTVMIIRRRNKDDHQVHSDMNQTSEDNKEEPKCEEQ